MIDSVFTNLGHLDFYLICVTIKSDPFDPDYLDDTTYLNITYIVTHLLMYVCTMYVCVCLVENVNIGT